MHRKKKQNSYDGQIVKQSDGVYDVVIPKIITPPRKFNPLIIENIRTIGVVLEEPSQQTNRPIKISGESPSRIHFLSLGEFTMTFSENDSNVEKTLKNIELTPEEFGALKTIPGLEFRGIPLDQGVRKYCQKDEIQFDVLVSGKILMRYPCIKSQNVVKTLLNLFQLQTTSTLVPTIPTGFNGTNANLTPYMSIMTQNPQSIQQNPQINPQMESKEYLDFSKLLATKEAKVTQTIANKSIPFQGNKTNLVIGQDLVRPKQKEMGLETVFQEWISIVHQFYRHVNPPTKFKFEQFINKPLAISEFSELAIYISQALSQTRKFGNIISKLYHPNIDKTPNPNIDFQREEWLDSINLQEPNDVLYTKITTFGQFLENLLKSINPIFDRIRDATFNSLKTTIDTNCTQGYACFEYFQSGGGPSIKTISLLDLLVTLRSYTCNVMNNINNRDIEIDATTICNLEHRMQFTRDLFHYLVGKDYKIPVNPIEFCQMLILFLKDVTSQQDEESWLLYSFEEVKKLTKRHPNVFKTITKLITSTKYDLSDFDVLRNEISSYHMLLNYVHFILVCILLQMCGMLTSQQILTWLNLDTNPEWGKLQRNTTNIAPPGLTKKLATGLWNLFQSKPLSPEQNRGDG